MKILILICLFILYPQAKTITANFHISYGLFSNMGETNASISIDNKNNYKIIVKAKATGIASFFSNNLIETYTSQGTVVNKIYKTNLFTKHTKTNSKEKYFEYKFNHNKKIITLSTTKKIKKYDYSKDITTFKWKTQSNKTILSFYGKEDILSLFFNIKNYLKDFKQGQLHQITAIGSSIKRKGKIDLIIPKGNKYTSLQKILKRKNNILIVKIYTNIFSSASGKLLISLNDQGICNKAILEDVLFFGDVTAVLK